MSVVLKLVPRTVRETAAILSALLARAMRGEIIGIAVCFRCRDGQEQAVFTGPYNEPNVAAGAALRMSMQMAGMT